MGRTAGVKRLASGQTKVSWKQKRWVGAHVSAAGGVEHAVSNAASIGATAFALFTRSQRKWSSPPLGADSIAKFQALMDEHGYIAEQVVPHGSYLLNCGSPDPLTLKKSREGLVDEVTRCEQLQLMYYNFHPGSTTGKCSTEESVKTIAESINYVHERTKHVIILIENMSRQGHTLGGAFEELRDILQLVNDQSRVAVCFDTCHAFAAGYDLSTTETYEATFALFDQLVGLDRIKAFHLNDSKGELGCHKDRHEKIGKGKLGIEAFRMLMNDPRFLGIPMILETPVQNKKNPHPEYQAELELLHSLVLT